MPIQVSVPSLRAYGVHLFNPSLISVAACAPIALTLSLIFQHAPHSLFLHIALTLAVAFAGYVATVLLVPIVSQYTMNKGMSGRDLNKGDTNAAPVPESLGLVAGVVYVVCIVVVEVLYIIILGGQRSALVELNAALHCITFMLFLGFVDDVVDLPWRYKMVMPMIATLPLLVAYHGTTAIIVPKLPLLRWLLGGAKLELGIIYRLYMGALAVFSTNAINILAGINGLECGQSLVIGIAIAVHNILELTNSDSITANNHLLSLLLVLPFIAVTCGLLRYNFYPSEVFVGDSYTTFAGMTLAACGILGHFSKTLLLFLIPQIVNFLYSLPQILRLFGLTCPRHRLPKLNPSTGLMEGVREHHNLVNLVLIVTGPLHERTLCILLLALQTLCCAFAFAVRYQLSKAFY